MPGIMPGVSKLVGREGFEPSTAPRKATRATYFRRAAARTMVRAPENEECRHPGRFEAGGP
jgi:hypothetical protein